MVMRYPSSQEPMPNLPSTSRFLLRKIISGGQTGADQGGLEAGRELGIETGGTAPYNWITATGPEKEMLEGFGLVAGPFDPKTYPKRTVLNVQNSDGTVWFGSSISPGGKLTLSTCRKEGKPYIVNPLKAELRGWIIKQRIQTLNVAGNREHKNPGIGQHTKQTLIQAFRGEKNEPR